MALLIDDGSRTSPGLDTLNPALISGPTLKINERDHGCQGLRAIYAPSAARMGDIPYVLKFKVLTPLRNLPGTSNTMADGTGWLTANFAPGAGLKDIQVGEISKAGSTPGVWTVFS